jgi:hypothetical protein
MKLSISVEGLFGLTWSGWKSLTSEIEQLGFYGSYCSDHFAPWDAPIVDSPDVFIALTYLASHSQQLQMGTMVSPLTFRDPVMMARQAVAIDELSGGRMILGSARAGMSTNTRHSAMIYLTSKPVWIGWKKGLRSSRDSCAVTSQLPSADVFFSYAKPCYDHAHNARRESWWLPERQSEASRSSPVMPMFGISTHPQLRSFEN